MLPIVVWNFLKSSQVGSAAIAAIDGLVTPLNNSPNQDIHLAVNVYLSWVEEADRQLGSFMESRKTTEDLYTERYWRIRAIDDSTVRPFPLLQHEVASQKARLEQIRDELTKYSGMVKVPENGAIVVCDTNVHMHGKLFSELPWTSIADSTYVLLLVPLVVVDELDDIKNRGGDTAKWARRVIKEMQKYSPAGAGLGPFPVRQNVTLQFGDEPRGHKRLPRPDDEIIRQAEYFSSLAGGALKIVSRDRGMLLRAQSTALHNIELPPVYDRKEDPCRQEVSDYVI